VFQLFIGLAPLGAFRVLARNLMQRHKNLVKFADDLTLVAPAAAIVSVEAEFASVQSWARDNKLQINLAKTKEIVITRCGGRGFMHPPLIAGVARENLVKLIGVTFNNHLSFADHVLKLQIVARQRLYLLQLLKRQGLDSTCLEVVFKAIVLSTMLYASLFRLPH